MRAMQCVMALACAAGLASAQTTVVDFENGAEGWTGPQGPGGASSIDPNGGNGGGAGFNTVFNDFGITFATNTNQDFLGDYTTGGPVTLSIDVKVDQLSFFGLPSPRPWLVELRDFDTAQGGFPWTSVWFLFDTISEADNADWMTYSVTIADPTQADLPAGWGGYGDEDPNTFEPILPSGVTFADVLSGVDELAFHTLQPGFFFGFTDFDVTVDNITISRVPAPASAVVLAGLGIVGTRRRR